MSKKDLPTMPSKKYNDWCEKRPIVNNDMTKWEQADAYATRKDLTPYEKSAFYLHKHTGCEGIEFVAFSNIRLKKFVILGNDVVLVPCFLHEFENISLEDPLLQATFKMMDNGKFVYDGWTPLAEWDEPHVRGAIRNIDEALSLFCLRGRSYFTWEPKYPENPSTFNLYHDFHLAELEQVMGLIYSLQDEDRIAVFRSLGWLSKGIHLNDPIVRFFFSILAVESLSMYIERTAAAQSPFSTLRNTQLSKEDFKKQREACIDEVISIMYQKNRIKAITKAYSDCVVSLTSILKEHIKHIFEPDTSPFDLLFKEKVENKSLYDLRHEIAHGSADVLSEIQRDHIRKRVWDAESIARRYILAVLEKALNIRLTRSSGMFAASFTPLHGVMNQPSMYGGPTHMALLYS